MGSTFTNNGNMTVLINKSTSSGVCRWADCGGPGSGLSAPDWDPRRVRCQPSRGRVAHGLLQEQVPMDSHRQLGPAPDSRLSPPPLCCPRAGARPQGLPWGRRTVDTAVHSSGLLRGPWAASPKSLLGTQPSPDPACRGTRA
uniref:Uncharacterized protein n=1 Tax=Molossus molossus TaxID=27622 RepID=A0A7J8GQH1_MOLMO|nr:hypothetical protein HJG59_011224 [Molossus molossus]